MFYPLRFLERRRPVEQRTLADPTVPPSWAEISGGSAYTPVSVTLEKAVGLPAVGAAVRLLSETVAQLPLNVYRGRGPDKRLADQTWQYRLLCELPGMGDFTPFDLLSDVVACLETHGNAFLQKVKGGAPPQVIALIVIDPARVEIKRENGEKRFYVREDGGRQTGYSASSILHIRGFTVAGADAGLSPITAHRQALSGYLAQSEFQTRFYGQGTHVGGVVESPQRLTDEQAKEIRAQIEKQHGGTRNSHLPLVLEGGMTWKGSGSTLEDAQFVEGERLNLVQVAHIFRIPPGLLLGDATAVSEQDMLRFYVLSVGPRLRRLELALASDADLFPQRVIYPEFDVQRLLRTDAATQAEVHHKQVQAGVKTPDEVRGELGLAPLPAGVGAEPQITPVGGAPNPPQAQAAEQPSDEQPTP